jgi:hypothetical protein
MNPKNPNASSVAAEPPKKSAPPRLAPPHVWAKRLDGRAIKIIGLGGIGTWVAQALVQFLASLRAVCQVWLVDGDSYEESNHSRALFQSYGNKAAVKAAELEALARGGPTIIPVPRYVTPRNVRRLIEEGDIVLLCVDNHKSRKCLGNAAGKLRNVLVISGGNDGTEQPSGGTFGNVIVYCRENGRDVTNPLTQFHPEIAHPTDKGPYELSCADLAQSSAPQLLYTNMQVATTMLCALLTWLNGRLAYEEVYLDILDAKMTPVARPPRDRSPRP